MRSGVEQSAVQMTRAFILRGRNFLSRLRHPGCSVVRWVRYHQTQEDERQVIQYASTFLLLISKQGKKAVRPQHQVHFHNPELVLFVSWSYWLLHISSVGMRVSLPPLIQSLISSQVPQLPQTPTLAISLAFQNLSAPSKVGWDNPWSTFLVYLEMERMRCQARRPVAPSLSEKQIPPRIARNMSSEPTFNEVSSEMSHYCCGVEDNIGRGFRMRLLIQNKGCPDSRK